MKSCLYLSLFWLLGILSGCSNTRFLSEDQILYTGRKKVEIIKSEDEIKALPVRNYVESITNHKVNNSLFGYRVLPPVGLWVHNYIKVDKGKKFKKWLYKTLSSDPVLMSDVNPELRSSKIENDLFDMGYFNSNAWSVVDTNRRNPHKAKVTYFINLTSPFHYYKIVADTVTDQIDSLIRKDKIMTEIKTGEQFNLEKIKTSRANLSRRIQDSGYFYFTPEYIEIKADTLVGKNLMNLMIGKKMNLPETVTSIYKINNIDIINLQKSDSTGSKT